MANKYSEALLSAIDILAKQRIKDAGYDKTIVAEIVSKKDVGTYLLKYGSTIIEAFSPKEYALHTMVYVLIPQNNMGQEKQILGEVNFFAKQKTLGRDSQQVILLYSDMKGLIIENQAIVGFVDNENQHIYFDKSNKEDKS